jgi:hypothetical protein
MILVPKFQNCPLFAILICIKKNYTFIGLGKTGRGYPELVVEVCEHHSMKDYSLITKVHTLVNKTNPIVQHHLEVMGSDMNETQKEHEL